MIRSAHHRRRRRLVVVWRGARPRHLRNSATPVGASSKAVSRMRLVADKPCTLGNEVAHRQSWRHHPRLSSLRAPRTAPRCRPRRRWRSGWTQRGCPTAAAMHTSSPIATVCTTLLPPLNFASIIKAGVPATVTSPCPHHPIALRSVRLRACQTLSCRVDGGGFSRPPIPPGVGLGGGPGFVDPADAADRHDLGRSELRGGARAPRRRQEQLISDPHGRAVESEREGGPSLRVERAEVGAIGLIGRGTASPRRPAGERLLARAKSTARKIQERVDGVALGVGPVGQFRTRRAVTTDAPPRPTRRKRDRPRRAPVAPRVRRRVMPRPRVLIRSRSHSTLSRGCSRAREPAGRAERTRADGQVRPLAIVSSGRYCTALNALTLPAP